MEMLSFKDWVFVFFMTLILFSCSEKKEDNAKYIEQYEAKKEQKRIQDSIKIANLPKPDTNLINANNVVDKLTYFGNQNHETKIKINTKFGSMVIKLYEDTPLHRANFLMLCKNKYFDSTFFYRVVPGFMIQGGNSDRDDVPDKMKKIGFYTVPDEILPHHIHKKGALAMAVSEQLDIPEEERNKFSSPYNFYIVQNGPLSDLYLKNVIKKYDLNISDKDKQTYRTVGGAPHLDGNYTVFGEVISGFNVIDKIATLPTDVNERPIEDITLSVEVLE